METATSYSSYGINFAMVMFATVVVTLAMTLVAGGVIAYRKGKQKIERVFTTIGIAGGAIILATITLGGFEFLPESSLLPLLYFELGLLAMIFWVWMLVDCAVNESSTGNDKIVWVIIVMFTHVLGAGLYLFIRRPRRLLEMGG